MGGWAPHQDSNRSLAQLVRHLVVGIRWRCHMHSNRLLLLLMLLLLPRGKLPLRELACHRRRRIGSRWLPLPFIAPPSHALTPLHLLAGNERVAGSSRRADARPCDGRGGRLRRLQVVRAHLECQSELAGLCRRFIRARWLMHAMMWCRMYCMPLAFWSCAAAYLSGVSVRCRTPAPRPACHDNLE